MPVLIPIALLGVLLPGLAWPGFFSYSQTPRAPDARPALARLADAFGLAMALIALAGMATFFLPLHWTPAWLGLAAVGLLAAALRPVLRTEPAAMNKPLVRRERLLELASLAAFAGLIFFRFYQARDLVLPAWVDSIHHSLLVRLIIDRGGLPPDFTPFMPVGLYYHTGFHTAAALFSWLARLGPAQGVLIFGQLLNAAAGLGVYRLAWTVWGDRRKALAALLLTGFAFQMPAYYLTWGRYTLLAGILLLCLAVSAALEGVRKASPGCEPAARLAALTAGLLLTHYFAALLFALFLAVFTLERITAERGFLRSAVFYRLTGGVTVGLVLALPWLAHVLRGASDFIAVGVIPPGASPDEAYFVGYLEYLVFLLGPYRAHVLHGLGLAGLLLLGLRPPARPLAGFSFVLILAGLPWGVRLAPFRPDHAVILGFLPGALFSADLLISAADAPLQVWVRPLTRGLAAAALVGLLAWGIRDTRRIVNPVTVLAGESDLQALAWIEVNTPPEGVFLINTAGWQGGAYRGVDGGWWIAPQTGRRTVLPPALYIDGGPEYAADVIELARRTSELTACDAAFWDVVARAGADHLYLRAGTGSLQPPGLLDCSKVTLVYRQDGVHIYRLDP